MAPRAGLPRMCSPNKNSSPAKNGKGKKKREATPSARNEKQSSKKSKLEQARDRLNTKKNDRVLKEKGPPPKTKKSARNKAALIDPVANPKDPVPTEIVVEVAVGNPDGSAGLGENEREDDREDGGSPAKSNPNGFMTEPDRHDDEVDDEDDDESDNEDNDDSQGALEADEDNHQDDDNVGNITTFASGVRQQPRTDATAAGRHSQSTPSRKKKGHVSLMTHRRRDMERLQHNGWMKWIHGYARLAVFDVSPPVGDAKPLHQHLYWALNPRISCALNLIRRESELQKEAVEFGGIDLFAREICDDVITHSRKAKNKHINEIRNIFFGTDSEFKIVDHALEATMRDADGDLIPMRVCAPFISELPTADSIAELLMSSEMHAHKVFYPNFVRALAAGKLCRVKKQVPGRPLASFMSVTHEAHFRLELWACLKQQG
jgi:hypothetical protein